MFNPESLDEFNEICDAQFADKCAAVKYWNPDEEDSQAILEAYTEQAEKWSDSMAFIVVNCAVIEEAMQQEGIKKLPTVRLIKAGKKWKDVKGPDGERVTKWTEKLAGDMDFEEDDSTSEEEEPIVVIDNENEGGLEAEGYEFHSGTTLKREHPEHECMEYYSYAGGNVSDWTEDDRYYHRENECHKFNKPPLTLKKVWWMNPWVMIESVELAEGENKLDLHLEHYYEPDMFMKAALKVFVSEWNPEDPAASAKVKKQFCPVISRFPTGDGEWLDPETWLDEHVITLNLDEEWSGKTVAVYVQIISQSRAKKCNWRFNGASVMVNSPCHGKRHFNNVDENEWKL